MGAGFLVRPNLIATCAHVVSASLDRRATDHEAPQAPVVVDFPSADATVRMHARVRHWSRIREDGRGDIAILELIGSTPDSVAPLPFWPAGQPWGGEFRMFGFPAEMPEGVWVSGEFRAAQRQGWVQLQAAAGGQPITEGFSGAAVWDTEANAVAGMAVAADGRRYTRTAFMLPIDEVLRLDPALLSSPYRGMLPFGEQHAEFFYGRDDDIARVLEALRQRSFAAVVGRSGTGKSSLVWAGVLPRLRQQGRHVAAFRLSGDASAESGVRAITSGITGDEPLSTWLVEHASHAPEADDLAAAGLLEKLPQHGTLLFVDQFEDLVAAAPQRARALLQALIKLTRAGAEGRIEIVLTLRWDALDDLLDAELAEFLGSTTVAVAPLGRAQLRDAISRPAARAGVVLDDIVVERLIEGVFDQPGGLPLLASVLSDLWDRHTGGRITLADYENVGSVEVSIARRAEHVMAQFADPTERADAERILKLLAVPASSGAGFVRAVVPMREYPELRGVVGRLALDRLVVVGRDKDGEDTVELAHQALIDNWERLHDLLQSDRDFRAWQQQLAQDLDNWERRGREDDALLRGTALDAAENQLEARKPDVPQAHREFIAASRRLRGREVRRLRIVAAALTVLVVVATSMAVVAYRSSQARAAQLRLQAGRDLAAESMRVADTDPDKALQFAQAAARHAPDDHAVRTALLNQQVRMASATSYQAGLWKNLAQAVVSGDGFTVVTAEDDHNITVWTRLTSDEPLPWRLPPSAVRISSMRLSRNGARLAVVTEDGAVVVWDVRDHRGPTIVRAPEPTLLPDMAVVTTWDEDGHWLAVRLNRSHFQQPTSSLGHTDALDVYDMAGAEPVRVAALPPLADFEQYPLYIDPTGTLMAFHEVSATTSRNVVRDARTGQVIRELPNGTITTTGLIVGCRDEKLVISDALSGVERLRPADGRRTVKTGGCEWEVDRSERYAVRADADEGDVLRLVYIIDLRTGQASAVQARNLPSATGVFLVMPSDAGPRLTQFTRSGVLHFAPAVSISDPSLFYSANFKKFVWSPRGRFVVAIEPALTDQNGTIRVFEMAPAIREVARITVPAGGRFAAEHITRDEQHLVTADSSGDITIYALSDLAVERRISLPFPPELRGRPSAPTSIMQPGADELGFLYAGSVTRWRMADGEQLGQTLRTWSDVDELRWMVEEGALAQLVPTHPDQFVVATRNADVVREFDDGRVLHSLPVDIRYRYENQESFVRPGTPIVYTRFSSGRSMMQNLETGVESSSPQQIPAGAAIVGMTDDGLLVVDNLGTLQIWDFDRGAKLFDIKASHPEFAVVGGDTLFFLTTGSVGRGYSGRYEVDLDRDDMLRRLCAISDREYTQAERDDLPVGADTTAPCRDR
ncbi:LpqB family beta-propeller domain-containing protein [Nocardia sp. 2YAB30]|uniref:LpqB family beta-propeller domain-containing protein n=1 Tax=Nocardia sp. 2YAB30 TaxID=3233022 RepID=UPI003F97E1A9